MIDQLRNVPQAWAVGQIKHAGDVTLGKMLQSSAKGDGDIELPYMRAANVQPDGVLKVDDVKSMWFTERESSHLTLKRGDVVVVEGGIGGYGRAAFVGRDLDAWGFQNSINRIRPYDACDGRFIAYYLIAARYSGFIEAYCNVVSMPHLTVDKLESMPCPLPPRDQQQAIADYLDRETAKIDALIEKQERLIETLAERRSAVLAQLFDDLKVDLMPLRRGITFLTSGSRGWGNYYSDHGHRFVRIGNLSRGSLALRGEVQRIDLPADAKEGTRTHLAVNDLLFSITAYLGSVAMADSDWSGGYVSQHVALCRLGQTVFDPLFVGWFMLSPNGQDQLKRGADGGTKLQLSLGDVREIQVPRPDLHIQTSVANRAHNEARRIDVLTEHCGRLIELSRERRAALITAAVTGQIDVPSAA